MSVSAELYRRPQPRSPTRILLGVGAVLAILVLVRRFGPATVVYYAVYGGVVGSALFLVWRAQPVYSFTLALVLAPMAANWEAFGIPGIASPNRVVLAVAVTAVLLRGAASIDRPTLRIQPVHWWMAAASVYAISSAVIAQTFDSSASIASLGERFGIIPFFAFLVAPAVFRTERDRSVLLVALVALGAYFGLTALFETIGQNSLVFPSYILDPAYGILPDRARGPFVDPPQFALAMFVCAGASVIALGKWRTLVPRLIAAAVIILCAAGILFTLTRAAWLGAIAGTIVSLLVVPRLRKLAIPLAVVGVLVIAVALAAVPGFSSKAADRRTHQTTVYDRYVLNQAALDMVEERPLFGFGWGTYFNHNREYLRIGDDYPLPTNIENVPVHNLYLGFAAELGLIGTLLWLVAVGLAVGGAIFRRGSPEIMPWRYLMLAVAVFYLSISNFEPTTIFSTLILLLLAGVVNGGSPHWAFEGPARRPAAAPPATSA